MTKTKVTRFVCTVTPVLGYCLGFYMLFMQNWRIAVGVLLVAIGINTSLYSLVTFVGNRLFFLMEAIGKMANEPPDKIIK